LDNTKPNKHAGLVSSNEDKVLGKRSKGRKPRRWMDG